jgi:hypothetical protein
MNDVHVCFPKFAPQLQVVKILIHCAFNIKSLISNEESVKHNTNIVLKYTLGVVTYFGRNM